MSVIISDSGNDKCDGYYIAPPKTKPNGFRRRAAAMKFQKRQGDEDNRHAAAGGFVAEQKEDVQARTSELRRKSATARAFKGQGVFLVVDRPVTREGLALMLRQAHFTIVGQAGNSKETFENSNLALADAVIVDLLSGDKDLVCLIKALSSRQLRSVVCSIHEDSTRIRAALVAGASGYVTTKDETQHLIEAIRAVIGGRDYVSPRAGAGLAKRVAGLDDPSPKEDLSKQQLQIYELLGQGDNAKEISSRLKISPRTVESYCSRMIYKLDLSGMKALRRLAISNVHSALLYA